MKPVAGNPVAVPAVNPVESTPSIVVKSIEPATMRLIRRVFDQEARANPQGVRLSLLNRRLIEADPTFNHKEYGTPGLKAFCRKLAPQYTIKTVGKGSKALHFLRRRDELAKNTPMDLPAVMPVALRLLEQVASKPSIVVKSIDPATMRLVGRVFDPERRANPRGMLFSVLNNRLLKADPTFNHKEYGTGRFKAFCEKLAPQYTITSVDTECFLRRRGELTKKTTTKTKKPAVKPVVAVVPVMPVFDIRLIEQVFDDLEAHATPNGLAFGVQLGSLKQRLVAADPTFNYKEYSTGGFKDFCEKIAPQYTIKTVGMGPKAFYFLRRRDELTKNTPMDLPAVKSAVKSVVAVVPVATPRRFAHP
jgi:hypothetical protein